MTSKGPRKRRISLSTKFSLLTLSLVLITALGIAVYAIEEKKADTYEELLNRGRTEAIMLAQNSEYGIYTENKPFLRQLIESLSVDANIAYVAIFNKEKKILAYKATEPSLDRIPPELYSNSFFSDRIVLRELVDNVTGRHYINITSPVVSASGEGPEVLFLDKGEENASRIIGYVQLGLTLKVLHKRIRQFFVSTLLITLAFIVLAFALTLLITKKIAHPIKMFADVAKDISEGKLDHRIEVNTGDEIADLAGAFNQMLVRLREYRKTVEEHTLVLSETNEKLQQEVLERKEAEKALADEKERLAVTLRSIGEGVITSDTQGTVVLLNREAEKLTGWSQREALGRRLGEVFNIVNEKSREPCSNPFQRVLDHGDVVTLAENILLLSKDGTERNVAASAAPISNRNSEIIGVVLVFRDITEKRQMEEEIIKAQKLESIGILAGGIAHDFNNILTAILSNISIARIYLGKDDRVLERLVEAEKASMRAKDLTQQLLTFSKGGTPIKKTMSIVELVKDSARFALRGSNVTCEFLIPDDLRPVEVDEGQMSQVISNIVINASQAMPEGGTIRIKAENVDIRADASLPLNGGGYIKIDIEDSGVGIPREHLRKIFDPYFTTKQRGSGLGLAVTYSIIRNHDGHISVESCYGKGTVFHIYLPASDKEVAAGEEAEEVPVSGKGRILLMDDEEMILDVASQSLRLFGYEVVCARDGSEAVRLYKEAKEEGEGFDAVIFDLIVPGGMGGKEALGELIKTDPDIRAIVSSGYSNDPIMANYRKDGFVDVVTKPYKIDKLISVLNRVVSGRR